MPSMDKALSSIPSTRKKKTIKQKKGTRDPAPSMLVGVAELGKFLEGPVHRPDHWPVSFHFTSPPWSCCLLAAEGAKQVCELTLAQAASTFSASQRPTDSPPTQRC